MQDHELVVSTEYAESWISVHQHQLPGSVWWTVLYVASLAITQIDPRRSRMFAAKKNLTVISVQFLGQLETKNVCLLGATCIRIWYLSNIVLNCPWVRGIDANRLDSEREIFFFLREGNCSTQQSSFSWWIHANYTFASKRLIIFVLSATCLKNNGHSRYSWNIKHW